MSDWSLVSGNSSNGDGLSNQKSDNDFTLVDHPSVLARSTSAPTAMIALSSMISPTADAQVAAWLREQALKLISNPSVTEQPKALNQDWVEPLFAKRSASPSATKTLKIYKIELSELPKSINPKLGYFTIAQHPSTWYACVTSSDASHSFSLVVFSSIEHIAKSQGEQGLLQVILWARVFNTKNSNGKFWKAVEGAALGRLPKQDFLVQVGGFMRSIRGRTEPRLAKKYDLKEFFEGDKCWFAVKCDGAFKWVSPKEAEEFKLGKEIAG